jgi:hypothetical protein
MKEIEYENQFYYDAQKENLYDQINKLQFFENSNINKKRPKEDDDIADQPRLKRGKNDAFKSEDLYSDDDIEVWNKENIPPVMIQYNNSDIYTVKESFFNEESIVSNNETENEDDFINISYNNHSIDNLYNECFPGEDYYLEDENSIKEETLFSDVEEDDNKNEDDSYYDDDSVIYLYSIRNFANSMSEEDWS